MIKKALLPSEYQQVEYIDTRGSGQYIDTGVPADNDNLSFEIKYKFNAISAGYYQYIIGAWTNESTNATRLLQYGLDMTYLNVNTKPSGGTTTFSQTRDANTIYEETLSKSLYTSNNSTQAITATTTGTAYSGNVLLFRANPTATSASANVRLYYFRIYDNGVIIRNFIPCYRKSNNVIGLYDLVTNTFFTNQGTSYFYKGEDVETEKEVGFIYKNNQNIDKILNNNNLVFEQGFTREDSGTLPLTTSHQTTGKDLKDYKVYGNSTQSSLPSEYQEVEYIQSTGTQYINTGYEPNQNSKMWLDYQPTEAQSSMYAGARRTSSNARYFTINSGNASTLMYGAFGSSGNVELGSMTTNRVQTQIGIDGIYYNDSKKYTPSSSSSFTLTEKVLLFGVMQNGTTASLLAKAKIYGCKIWESDTLIRDFIPCYRKSDSVAGMYDIVNNVFYTNQGTGTFTVGTELPTQNNPLEIKSVGNKTINLFNKNETRAENLTQWKAKDKSKPIYGAFNVAGWTDNQALGDGFHYLARALAIPCSIGDKFKIYFFDGLPTTRRHFYSYILSDYTLKTGTRYAVSNNEGDLITAEYNGWFVIEWGLDNDANDGIVIVKGEPTVTEYVPYGYRIPVIVSDGTNSTTTNIHLDEPLRKVGDYADYIDFKNQKVIRKIASFIFNSTNKWAVYRTNANNTVYNLNNTLTPLIGSPLLAPMCSHFKQVTTGGTADFNAGEMRFQMSGNTINGNRIYVSSSEMTLEAFNAWIEENSPELIYPLATQVEEPIALPNIPSYKGTTTYEVDTNIQPSNMYIKYKGK